MNACRPRRAGKFARRSSAAQCSTMTADSPTSDGLTLDECALLFLNGDVLDSLCRSQSPLIYNSCCYADASFPRDSKLWMLVISPLTDALYESTRSFDRENWKKIVVLVRSGFSHLTTDDVKALPLVVCRLLPLAFAETLVAFADAIAILVGEGAFFDRDNATGAHAALGLELFGIRVRDPRSAPLAPKDGRITKLLLRSRLIESSVAHTPIGFQAFVEAHLGSRAPGETPQCYAPDVDSSYARDYWALNHLFSSLRSNSLAGKQGVPSRDVEHLSSVRRAVVEIAESLILAARLQQPWREARATVRALVATQYWSIDHCKTRKPQLLGIAGLVVADSWHAWHDAFRLFANWKLHTLFGTPPIMYDGVRFCRLTRVPLYAANLIAHRADWDLLRLHRSYPAIGELVDWRAEFERAVAVARGAEVSGTDSSQ